jgi:hypothetical protein
VTFKVEWIDHEREPRNPPNPEFPDGVDIDMRGESSAPSCHTKLPYPALRCGYYVVECEICGLRVAVTTAGRRDDPRSIRITCRRPRS